MPSKCIICKLKRPNFGNPNDKIAKYCAKCKEPDMIDIRHPKCIICKLINPSFGLTDDKIAKYCFNCKEPDMINIISPKCIVCKSKHLNVNLIGVLH